MDLSQHTFLAGAENYLQKRYHVPDCEGGRINPLRGCLHSVSRVGGSRLVTGKRTITESNSVIQHWSQHLQKLLDEANFDEALNYVCRVELADLERQLVQLKDNPRADLHARCLLAEICDYGGLYDRGSKIIRQVGYKAQAALQQISAETTLNSSQTSYLVQQCWACLQFGMVYYRRQDYDSARKLFSLALKTLERIGTEGSSMSVVSRAYYCLGLLAREEHRYDTARQYFSRAMEHSWHRLEQQPGQATAFIEYNIGRALGLGMAWLAYARASMSEADSHLVAAKLLLRNKAVKYIAAYIDVVHACTQRSRAVKLSEAQKAIDMMEKALAELGGKDVLNDPSKGNLVYARRAIGELAMAYLSAARICGKISDEAGKQEHLKNALEYVSLIKSSFLSASAVPSQVSISDRRTYCNALIIQSRVLRERGEHQKALASAEAANRVGRDEPFSRIDCWLTLGEAHYWLGVTEGPEPNQHYNEAVICFRKTRDDKHAQTNPKVVAVCDLQLARCHLKMGQIQKAEELLRIWQTSGCPGRDNAFVRNLSEEIDKNISELEVPFVISVSPHTLNADVWLTELRYWLVKKAMKKANNNRKLAMQFVGLSSLNQFNKWLNRVRP